ncbi:MAG: Flp pilus assembly complex ATPase component TadA [Kofleriaceae bacterium]|nr:Flp pilus assembly complex ATPase component TadA [Kofleriaceae bacterium]
MTGSGKSATLAAMVDYVNTQHAYHIVTVEDPIEYSPRLRSRDRQRELGFDTQSISRARAPPCARRSRRHPHAASARQRDRRHRDHRRRDAATWCCPALRHRGRHRAVNRIIADVPGPPWQAQARLARWRSVLRGVIWRPTARRRAPTARAWSRRSPWSEPREHRPRPRDDRGRRGPARSRTRSRRACTPTMFTFDVWRRQPGQQHLVTTAEAV